MTSVPTGQVALTWNALANYDSPATTASKSLEKGGTAVFEGAYARQTGAVAITGELCHW